MSRMRALLLLALLVQAAPAPALRVPGLFEAEVPVLDQSAVTRQRTVSSALRLVLVKLTGDRHAGETAALAPLLAGADRYVQQFRYGEEEIPAATPDAPPRRELRLWVQFDEEALSRELRSLGVPIWERERPSTLLWLVVDGTQGRGWANAEEHAALLAAVESRAAVRGIPLLLPLFDLEDGAALTPADVWGGFAQPVLGASRRYNPDAVLAAALEMPAPGIWEVRWTALLGGESRSWSSSGDLPQAALEEGIDGMADLLALRFSGGGALEASTVEITVLDVNSADQYARAFKYLQSLNSISGLQVAGVSSGQVRFSMRVHGGEETLARAVALGRTLERLPDAAGGRYRLLP